MKRRRGTELLKQVLKVCPVLSPICWELLLKLVMSSLDILKCISMWHWLWCGHQSIIHQSNDEPNLYTDHSWYKVTMIMICIQTHYIYSNATLIMICKWSWSILTSHTVSCEQTMITSTITVKAKNRRWWDIMSRLW